MLGSPGARRLAEGLVVAAADDVSGIAARGFLQRLPDEIPLRTLPEGPLRKLAPYLPAPPDPLVLGRRGPGPEPHLEPRSSRSEGAEKQRLHAAGLLEQVYLPRSEDQEHTGRHQAHHDGTVAVPPGENAQ